VMQLQHALHDQQAKSAAAMRATRAERAFEQPLALLR
jgi:hypothetical protein